MASEVVVTVPPLKTHRSDLGDSPSSGGLPVLPAPVFGPSTRGEPTPTLSVLLGLTVVPPLSVDGVTGVVRLGPSHWSVVTER